MGYWENTTYVRSSDPLRVLAVLEDLFRQEGMHRIGVPPQRERSDYEPMQYAPSLENNLWGVAVFPGRESWTIIKTAPLELLSERAPNRMCMRISDLCRELAAEGFQVHVYDSASTILCEVLESGEVHISGFGDCNSEDPTTWQGRELCEELFEARFQVLGHQEIVEHASLGDDFASAISKGFGGRNAEHCDNNTSVEPLVMQASPEIEGGTVAYFEWNGSSRVLIPACSWEEYRNHGNG